MSRRNINQGVARNVSSAATTSKCSNESVARAADITIDDLNARLTAEEGFSVIELVRVGGFLRTQPADLMKGVSA